MRRVARLFYDSATSWRSPVLEGTSLLQEYSTVRLGSLLHARGLASGPPAREQQNYDVCIVGAGPAGLAAAIRLKQRLQAKYLDCSVAVIEKGSRVGAHLISGCVLDPRALNELLPGWEDFTGDREPAPHVTVKQDLLYTLTRQHKAKQRIPPHLSNNGKKVFGLGDLGRWLAAEAERLGVDVFTSAAAAETIEDADGTVRGVRLRDHGVDASGAPGPSYTPGADIHARVTLLAEGCRGSLSEKIIERHGLRAKGNGSHQTYALGFKEVWQLPHFTQSAPGAVIHTLGYPLAGSAYGGGFIYYLDDNYVSLGLVVGLDYRDPFFNPYEEFQRWKKHPLVAQVVKNATCVEYGARAINEGGYQSIPRVDFPGGALIGCSAGFVDTARLKGVHTAMKSGMLAADCIADELFKDYHVKQLSMAGYWEALKNSWVFTELWNARNIRPGFRNGFFQGLFNAFLDNYIYWGKPPYTLQHGQPDHLNLRPAGRKGALLYDPPDDKITFDINTSLYRSGTNHVHDQPCHLHIKKADVVTNVTAKVYAGPESRYCPAGVYTYVKGEDGNPELRIDAQNCLHCKACDIKDPSQNIEWRVPQGGDGPNYVRM